MSEQRPSPIRASGRAKKILESIAKEIGVAQIDLLDQAITALEDYFQHHNGRLILPLRFTETFRVYSLSEQESPQKRTVLVAPPAPPKRRTEPRSVQTAHAR